MSHYQPGTRVQLTGTIRELNGGIATVSIGNYTLELPLEVLTTSSLELLHEIEAFLQVFPDHVNWSHQRCRSEFFAWKREQQRLERQV